MTTWGDVCKRPKRMEDCDLAKPRSITASDIEWIHVKDKAKRFRKKPATYVRDLIRADMAEDE